MLPKLEWLHANSLRRMDATPAKQKIGVQTFVSQVCVLNPVVIDADMIFRNGSPTTTLSLATGSLALTCDDDPWSGLLERFETAFQRQP